MSAAVGQHGGAHFRCSRAIKTAYLPPAERARGYTGPVIYGFGEKENKKMVIVTSSENYHNHSKATF